MESTPEMKPCPFCGCSVEIMEGDYPLGDKFRRIYGWHDDGCPLQWLNIELTDDDENPLTREEIAERWNRRYEEP